MSLCKSVLILWPSSQAFHYLSLLNIVIIEMDHNHVELLPLLLLLFNPLHVKLLSSLFKWTGVSLPCP
uniref:Putative ovule protein n=1 Tax=Solanum chacoense TaxID=4108 RepID=A0A0V0HAB0_SOLCH